MNTLRIEEIAKKRGVSMAQVNIAWLLSKDGTFPLFFSLLIDLTAVAGVSAPIVGTTSLKNLEDIIGNRTWKLLCMEFTLT